MVETESIDMGQGHPKISVSAPPSGIEPWRGMTGSTLRTVV